MWLSPCLNPKPVDFYLSEGIKPLSTGYDHDYTHIRFMAYVLSTNYP